MRMTTAHYLYRHHSRPSFQQLSSELPYLFSTSLIPSPLALLHHLLPSAAQWSFTNAATSTSLPLHSKPWLMRSSPRGPPWCGQQTPLFTAQSVCEVPGHAFSSVWKICPTSSFFLLVPPHSPGLSWMSLPPGKPSMTLWSWTLLHDAPLWLNNHLGNYLLHPHRTGTEDTQKTFAKWTDEWWLNELTTMSQPGGLHPNSASLRQAFILTYLTVDIKWMADTETTILSKDSFYFLDNSFLIPSFYRLILYHWFALTGGWAPSNFACCPSVVALCFSLLCSGRNWTWTSSLIQDSYLSYFLF